MNAKMKKRMIVVTGIIVMVLIVVLAVVGSGTSAKSATVTEVSSGNYVDQRVQVSGIVVDDSFETQQGKLVFDMYDQDNPSASIHVEFDGSVAATFGNGVTAICTGKMGSDGTLYAGEMITKCPSKYENSADSIDVSSLLEYGDQIIGTPVKISGTLKPGTLSAVGSDDRFVLVSADGSQELPIDYEGALSDEIGDGTALIVSGCLSDKGDFTATDVAMEG